MREDFSSIPTKSAHFKTLTSYPTGKEASSKNNQEGDQIRNVQN